ncbi:unnamed protein product, partial [Ixodes persulcatus]
MWTSLYDRTKVCLKCVSGVRSCFGLQTIVLLVIRHSCSSPEVRSKHTSRTSRGLLIQDPPSSLCLVNVTPMKTRQSECRNSARGSTRQAFTNAHPGPASRNPVWFGPRVYLELQEIQ